MRERVILHSDLNGFYASVECFLHPELARLPVAVCGDAESRHGIVLAKNEHAKKFGIKTGHVIWEAKQLCPKLVTVKANFKEYVRFSELARKIYLRYSDHVESFGIDECWIDISRIATDPNDGRMFADQIRESIKKELGITASVGVSWNKIFAKLGSDIKKPDATTVISRDNYKNTVFNLAVEDLLMVGRATKAKLHKYNIYTIGDLANTDVTFLKSRLGKWGEYIWVYANGLDHSPVMHHTHSTVEKSVSNSTTTSRDLKSMNDVLMIVTVLSESVAARMRESGIKGDVVHLGVRDNELCHWEKQQTLKRHTFVSSDIITAAMSIFSNYSFIKPIRSLSVKVSGICPASAPVQTDMFISEEKRTILEKLEFATDEIRNRFGHFSINRGIEYLDRKLTAFNPKRDNTIHPQSFL